MPRHTLNTILGVALLLTIGLNLTGVRNTARPNMELMPNMVRSVASETFTPNPVLAGGMTLQAPEPGTIARGFAPLRYAATPEDAVKAGDELASPLEAGDRGAAGRGAAVFASYCQPCHGPGGLGDGPVTKRGFPPPPSLLAEKAMKMKDGQMFHVLTYGQANMPGYAAQVSREDRWKVILHIRSLQQQSAGSPQAPAEPPPAGSRQ